MVVCTKAFMFYNETNTQSLRIDVFLDIDFLNLIFFYLYSPDQTGGSVPSPTHYLSLFMMKSESLLSGAVQEVSMAKLKRFV